MDARITGDGGQASDSMDRESTANSWATPDSQELSLSRAEHPDSMVTIRLSSKLVPDTSESRHSLGFPTLDAQLDDPDNSDDAGSSSNYNPLITEKHIDIDVGRGTTMQMSPQYSKSTRSSRTNSGNSEPESGPGPDGKSVLFYSDDNGDIDQDRTETLDFRSLRSSRSSRMSTSAVSLSGKMASTRDSGIEPETTLSRRTTTSSTSSDNAGIDWIELDKSEEQKREEDGTDESTAFLLARLEQENNAIATDPKSSLSRARSRRASRPPSLHQIKRLVNEPSRRDSIRHSHLPNPPPMTELEFWSALVSDYKQTAQRLPTLTSNKIRNGVPAPLRGVVWVSIAGARDPNLEEDYERLSNEESPYDKVIYKDVGRSYPGVDMFRDPDGEGQKMLMNVLSAFSLWDQEIGYCQGLGFVVGPLLMHMGDKEAFCILVRLMEHYDLRSCFLPGLTGLHLRIFQFQNLLTQQLPDLAAHLEKLNVEPLYLSQWFLSFFGVTCPLPMLIRIYDVLLTEGASETLMRVALSLMRRNKERIMGSSEFDDIMQFLLSRGMWDTYSCNADDLVRDFCNLTGVVTREGLQDLENKFKENQQSDNIVTTPGIQAAAARFLGRFWAGAQVTKSSLNAPDSSQNESARYSSKQSMTSTLNSVETSESAQTGASTEATTMSRRMSADWIPIKQTLTINGSMTTTRVSPTTDKGLHTQIEDLLTALTNLQREHSVLASELQREREEREEDRATAQRVIERLRRKGPLCSIPEDGDDDGGGGGGSSSSDHDGNAEMAEITTTAPDLENCVSDLEARFVQPSKRSSLSLSTKFQLREEANRWKAQYDEEVSRTKTLTAQLGEHEAQNAATKEQLREARQRIADGYRDKQRLERTNRELRAASSSSSRRRSVIAAAAADLSVDTGTAASIATPPRDSSTSTATSTPQSSAASSLGLREFKLGRVSTAASIASTATTASASASASTSLTTSGSSSSLLSGAGPGVASATANANAVNANSIINNNNNNSLSTPSPYAKRGSSLAAQAVLATEDNRPVPDEALLLELVNAKTAEAVARQELDEVKAKLDVLRKLVSAGPPASPGSGSSSSGGSGMAIAMARNSSGSGSGSVSIGVGVGAGLARPTTPNGYSATTTSTATTATAPAGPGATVRKPPPSPGFLNFSMATMVDRVGEREKVATPPATNGNAATAAVGSSSSGSGGGGGFFSGWGRRVASTSGAATG